MCSLSRNSCAKVFDNNWSGGKNLRPKNLRGGGFNPPANLRVKSLIGHLPPSSHLSPLIKVASMCSRLHSRFLLVTVFVLLSQYLEPNLNVDSY